MSVSGAIREVIGVFKTPDTLRNITSYTGVILEVINLAIGGAMLSFNAELAERSVRKNTLK